MYKQDLIFVMRLSL